MIRLLALAALLCVPASAKTVYRDDLDSALEAARASGHFVLLDMAADWCPACRQLETEVWQSTAAAGALEKFEIVRVDADKLEHWSYRGFTTTDIPTVFVLDSSGRELTRFIDYDTRDHFLENLRVFLSSGSVPDLMAKRIASDPKNMDLRDQLYVYYLTTGRAVEAAMTMEDARALPGGIGRDEYKAMRFMGVTQKFHQEPQDLPGVIAAAKAFVADFSTGNVSAVLAYEAEALWLTGSKDEAASIMRGLIARSPDHQYPYWRLLDFSRKYSTLDAEASAALEAGLKKFPKDDYFLMQAARWLAAKGDKTRAAELLDRAIALTPNNGYYRDLRRGL